MKHYYIIEQVNGDIWETELTNAKTFEKAVQFAKHIFSKLSKYDQGKREFFAVAYCGKDENGYPAWDTDCEQWVNIK